MLMNTTGEPPYSRLVRHHRLSTKSKHCNITKAGCRESSSLDSSSSSSWTSS